MAWSKAINRSGAASPVWFPPFFEAYGGVEASVRLIGEAEKATHVLERMKRHGAVNAHHRIDRAFGLLQRAYDRVTGANNALIEALALYTVAPGEWTFPVAMDQLSSEIAALFQAIARMAVLLNAASEHVVELWNAGVGPEPKVEPPSRPQPPRRCIHDRTPSPTDRIEALFKRRRRSKAAAPEDAPRKVSRGRAPPSLADCPL